MISRKSWRSPLAAALVALLALAGLDARSQGVGPGDATITQAFFPTGQAGITAGTTTGSVALGSTAPTSPTALVQNTGAVTAYVRFGISTVVATTSDYPVLAGQSIAFSVGSGTYMAAITASGSAALLVTTGSGVPALSGGAVVVAGGTVITTPTAVTTTEKSTTIATGGAAVTIMATNTARKGCLLQNPVNATETLFIRFKSAATTGSADSYGLPPGGSITCAGPGGTVNTDAVSANAVTSAHVVVAEEYN